MEVLIQKNEYFLISIKFSFKANFYRDLVFPKNMNFLKMDFPKNMNFLKIINFPKIWIFWKLNSTNTVRGFFHKILNSTKNWFYNNPGFLKNLSKKQWLVALDTEHLFYQFFIDDEIRSSSVDEMGIIIIVYYKRGIKMLRIFFNFSL